MVNRAREIVSFPVKNNSMTIVHNFWTNFSRHRDKDFEVLDHDPKIPGYWQFQTNLDKDDFEFMMPPNDVKRFLYQMIEIYRSPELG